MAEEVLREGGDAVRVVFNKFHSAISFKPTMATVLNAEVSNAVHNPLQHDLHIISSVFLLVQVTG